jgi:glycosyltransferase involved in cell wall biosynthesis
VTIHDIGFCRDGSLYGRQRIGTDSRRSHRFLNGLVRVLSRGRYGANTFDYLDWSTRFALNNAHKVIAISDFTKQELIEVYNARSERISVIYNGYNNELYKPITDRSVIDTVLTRYGIKTPYLFYVGRLEKKKNIAALIEAFALLKQKRGADFDCRLCLAGDASFGFDEVKYSINEYGLEGDVITTGWVQENDLPALFAGATGFVFPSNYEGFGIPLLQAMAMGTPIAASNIASIPEIAGDAAVLFDPSDPADMALALERLLYDTKLRENHISAGRERVRLFDWERAAVSTLAVLES